MKTVHVFGVLMALVAVGLMVGSAQAADRWYVVKHTSGQTFVTDGKPGPDWIVTFGPFRTEDEAIRASGVGSGMGFSQLQMIPPPSPSLHKTRERPEFRDVYGFGEAG